MTEDQRARVFDMPHARVTLTPLGANVEIEVWPKTGHSAYAVVDANVAVLIARQLVELAGAQLAATPAAADAGAPGPEEDLEVDGGHAGPGNIVDLASRRRRGGGAS